MPKFKRELVPGAYLTAADMLDTLSQQQLVAAALDNTIVLAAEPAVAWLLDRCCIGRPVTDATAVGISDGSSSIVSRVGAAAAGAGVNRATVEVQQQFEQHQAQLLVRKQRRVRRTPGYVATAGITAPAATPGQPAAAAGVAPDMNVQQGDGDGAAAAAASVPIVAAVGGQVAAGVAPDGAANGVSAGAASNFGHNQQSGVEELALLQLVQLSCQEAFFLAHILACCSVYAVQQAPEQPQQQEQHPQQQQQQQQGQQPLAPAELWSWCCSNAPGSALAFVSRYAAYKHFRCKGWLPLPGLLYGADYVLYKLHPDLAHSDFLVLVMVERPEPTAAAAAAAAGGAAAGQQQQQQQPPVMDGGSRRGAVQLSEQQQQLQLGQHELSVLGGDGSSSAAGEGSVCTQLTWLDAHIMQRLARQVLKQLLLLYVVIPHGLQLGSVECMQQVSVREVLLQRWVPSEHREEGKP
jgi:hypothetical protein